jgi:hypothetical protein
MARISPENRLFEHYNYTVFSAVDVHFIISLARKFKNGKRQRVENKK